MPFTRFGPLMSRRGMTRIVISPSRSARGLDHVDNARALVDCHVRAARQTQAVSKDRLAHATAAHRAAGEDGLKMQRLPHRAGLYVGLLERDAHVFAGGAELRRVDAQAREPP